VADRWRIDPHREIIENTKPFVNPNPAFEFPWGLADIISSLLDARLQLTQFREYPYSNGWKPFPDMRELPDRRMVPPDGRPILPFMFGLVAQKPAS
jgi:hypothetical protein